MQVPSFLKVRKSLFWIFLPQSIRNLWNLSILFSICWVSSWYIPLYDYVQEITLTTIQLILKLFFCFMSYFSLIMRHASFIWSNVFKNGPSKICGRQHLKTLKGYGLLKRLILKSQQHPFIPSPNNCDTQPQIICFWLFLQNQY